MGQEEMANELDRIRDILREIDPTSEKYTTGVRNYHELFKTLHEELESCEADLNGRHKRELEKARLELERLEEMNRNKQATRELVFGIVKLLLSILGILAAIILTGSFEQTSILSQKCFSLIQQILKFLKV